MAKIFRLQENVPDVYARKSRDFQLLCNLFDILQGGLKYDIDTITSVVDTRYCNEKLLPLLQTKLGFFTNEHLTTDELRTLLTSFQTIVKNKGSSKGIRQAIELYLKVIGASRNSKITITNSNSNEPSNVISFYNNSYIVEVSIEGQITDTTLLTEILKYVLPAGYKLQYSFYQSTSNIDHIVEKGTINIVIISSAINNQVTAKDSSDIDSALIKYSYAEDIFDVNNGEYYILNNGTYIRVENDTILQDKENLYEDVTFTPVNTTLNKIIEIINETDTPYYLGKSLDNKQSLQDLLDAGVAAHIFTQAAVDNFLYLKVFDVDGTYHKEYVTKGSVHDESLKYYLDGKDGKETLIETTQQISLYAQYEWTITDNNYSSKLPEEIYYTTENAYYKFNKGQCTYYTQSSDIIVRPSSVSTSYVALKDKEYTNIENNALKVIFDEEEDNDTK